MVSPGKRMGASACSVFLFQKCCRFLAVMPLHKIIIDTERAVFKAASPAKPVVNLVLCNKIFFLHFHMVRYRECFLL